MIDGHTRRSFLLAGAALLAIPVLVTDSSGQQSPAQTQRPRPPALPAEMVKDFVGAAHGDLEKTRSMLVEQPGLLNATWDWGGGDFETALGGASHMGNRAIAEFLLAQGARIDLFCAAMMGLVEVVKPVIDAYPDAVNWKGPHTISLLRHGLAGKDERMIEYLRSAGAA